MDNAFVVGMLYAFYVMEIGGRGFLGIPKVVSVVFPGTASTTGFVQSSGIGMVSRKNLHKLVQKNENP